MQQMLGLLFTTSLLLQADEPGAAVKASVPAPADKAVERLVESARKSVVMISHVGRDGKQQGIGTGFVLSADGLIATNLHVIGQGRPIAVELANGRHHDVATIHAFDRSLDLAIVKIPAQGLVPLELGDSERLKEGQAVLAIGNPLGLTNSVVTGVVSGRRQMKSASMIQVAIPIEPGNSGGPLLDLQGRVQGILTLKSSLTSNLGFAMPINSLKPLLKKPNPVPMARWLNLGVVNPAEWKTVFDARWAQRGGKIVAEGEGQSFGGRSLCLWQKPSPERPFEVSVAVRLDHEAGAAGLVFYADGGDKHYGFYPSGGQLRLTRFDGPDVYSWQILRQITTSHYRPGEWNTLKVRLDKDRFSCYLNGNLITESDDHGLSDGKVGLAKFRDTRAEFKNFSVAKQLPRVALSEDLDKRIAKIINGASSAKPAQANPVDLFTSDAIASGIALRERAKQLEDQAARLRDLAVAVRERDVQSRLKRLLEEPENKIDLLSAALLLARLDNEDVDVEAYCRQVEGMAGELKKSVSAQAGDTAKLHALNKYFFEELGFHGSRGEYYSRVNSYLSDVLDDREGIPITLSIVYMELAGRIGLKTAGIGLPGHFLVQHVPAKGEPQLIDVFERGEVLSPVEARKKSAQITGRPVLDEQLAPVTKKAIITRMLHNLLGLAEEQGDLKSLLRYLNAVIAISPEAARERWLRAGARFQLADKAGALADVDWLIEHHPEGINIERVREFRRLLVLPER
jgi:regulator of sirC expression with transglutaminase-like and TPR domain